MERAREVLASRPAAELADFILSLAVASDGISEYVHAFVLSADASAAAEVLSNELRFLRNGERDSDYRYRKGAGHVARADRWLDAIDRSMLPRDSQVAMQLLTEETLSVDRRCAMRSRNMCRSRARIVCVTPSHQFPLGYPMSLARRAALLRFAREHHATVIEDD